MKTISPLQPESLYHACDLSLLDFETTADLTPLDIPLGQKRALEAIEFGVDIEQTGFNLFVLGATGLGKRKSVEHVLSQRVVAERPLSDWCYVNNFEMPQKPKVLQVPAGIGHKLRKDMESLVEDLLTSLPSVFQSEDYRTRRQEIDDEFQERQEQAFKKLSSDANERGVAVLRTPAGYTIGPMINGKLAGAEEFEKLSEDEKKRIEKLIADSQLELQSIIRNIPLLEREHYQRVKALNQEVTHHNVEQLIAWIENTYRDLPEVISYLAAVKKNAIENAEDFLSGNGSFKETNLGSRIAAFHEYTVNVIVDNRETKGQPILFEDNPTYQNLSGRVEYISQMGALLTDFTLIKSGSLLRANGGYLVLDAQKVLTHAFAWEGLKRALKSREVKIESLEEMLSLASTLSLEPESIPFNVKVILTGEPYLYYLLKAYDPEFGELFKVAADFSQDTARDTVNTEGYARLVAAVQGNNGTRPLNKGAVERVIENASRESGDSQKLSLSIENISELLHEADYWAGKENSQIIRVQDIEGAIEKRRYRQDKYREQMQEQITRGFKLIDTEGEKVAQVNGLSVLQVGDYAFGQPSRITATARLGQGNVIDIEREVKLGGHIHSKGVMILSSYLANRYAINQPFPLSATLVFEQSYGMVDGDSATAAELCVLLSALGEIPLQQRYAVTGSMNQLGEIQPIGGVNEKIEGFFDVCQTRGLSGEQGVIIPAANQVNLMLRADVRKAVAEKRFSIYTAKHVDDVMEILSGYPRGEFESGGQFSEGSFNRKIQNRIEALQQLKAHYAHQMKDDAADSGEKVNP
ncbi:MAG: ATP-binding protein [Porticoccaceae bacterium]